MNSDLIIKQFSVNILIYLVAFKISNVKDINYKKIIKVIIGTIITTTIYAICKGYVNAVFLLIISFTIQCIFLSIIIKDNINNNIKFSIKCNNLYNLYFGNFNRNNSYGIFKNRK